MPLHLNQRQDPAPKSRDFTDQVGWRLVGLLLGTDVADQGDEFFAYGTDEIILVEHDRLDLFTVDAYTYVAYQAAEIYRPSVMLFGATTNGRDLAGRLAVREAPQEFLAIHPLSGRHIIGKR